MLEKAIESASPLKCEIKILTPDGTPLYGQVEGKALDSAPGQERIQQVIMDTTDRKQAEDLLCQSRNELNFRVRQRTAELESRPDHGTQVMVEIPNG